MRSANTIIEEVKQLIKIDCRNRILNRHLLLTKEDLINNAEPEEFTKVHLIEPLLSLYNCKIIDREVSFFGTHDQKRTVDYLIEIDKKRYLLEAKPINANLVSSDSSSALEQLKEAFKLTEVYKDHEGGIATDGFRWVFINKEKKMVHDLSLLENSSELEELLTGKRVVRRHSEVKITKQFYKWYNALLNGGVYTGLDKKKHTILKDDCLVNSITGLIDSKSKTPIAQTIMDRLIFIKFLESKSIIKTPVLNYLANLPDERINEQMRSLFFNVMGVEKRVNVNHEFENIPFLNGGLFTRTSVEELESDYRINAAILREIFNFLDQFKFVSSPSDENCLDPEILGYIFEMSMSAEDRSGTGAVYTPKEVTRYMSRETIYRKIIEKTNVILKEMGYKDAELVFTMDEIYSLHEKSLERVFNEVLVPLRICDNACGSGAFLLSCAEVLLDIYAKIDEKRNLNNEIIHKKLILKNNIYGVDLNEDAVEIAKLRLWLWMADSYNDNNIEPLPNIDYNLRSGNTLVGYTSISKFYDSKPITIEDWGSDNQKISVLLSERERRISEYKNAHGLDSKAIKRKVDLSTTNINKYLNRSYYNECLSEGKIDKTVIFDDFKTMFPFHWELEFKEVFEKGGFDIIIGNPPYLRIQGIRDELGDIVDIYTNNYSSATGNYDLFVLFIERSLQLINDGGLINYIAPPKWINSDFGLGLRRKMIETKAVDRFISLGAYQVFDVSTYSSIVWFSSRPKRNLLFTRVDDNIENNTELEAKLNSLTIENDYSAIPYIRLTEDNWDLMSNEAFEIVSKIRLSNLKISDVFDKIFVGIQTSQDSVYVLSDCSDDGIFVTGFSKELNQSVSIESGLMRPMLKGEDVKQFSSLTPSHYVIIPYDLEHLSKSGELRTYSEKDLVERYPKGYDYIKQNEQVLRQREKGKIKDVQDWYRYIYPKNLQHYRFKRIMTPEISRGCNMTYDETGTLYHNTKVYSFVKKEDGIDDILYYLSILNSPVLWFYLYHTGYILRGGFLTFKTDYLNPFPLPNRPEDSVVSNIIEICREILSQKKLGIITDDLQEKLNNIIYEIYELTPEQIEIVQNTYPR